MTSPDLSGAVGRVPHCQLCGGDVEGWICQTCESDFEEVDGLLLLKSDNTHARLSAALSERDAEVAALRAQLDAERRADTLWADEHARALAAEAALAEAREAAEKDGAALERIADGAFLTGPATHFAVCQDIARTRLNERKP